MSKSYVTMEQCCVCHEATGSILLDRRLKDSFEMYTETGNICDKCKDIIKNNITFICDTCRQTNVFKLKAIQRMGINLKAGEVRKIYKCQNCTGNGTLEILPPNYEAKANQ